MRRLYAAVCNPNRLYRDTLDSVNVGDAINGDSVLVIHKGEILQSHIV